jgi:hypothetical protein
MPCLKCQLGQRRRGISVVQSGRIPDTPPTRNETCILSGDKPHPAPLRPDLQSRAVFVIPPL